MKKTLLFFGFIAMAFVGKAHAQTLTFEPLPNNVAVGSSAEFTLNYTSTVTCKLEVSLNIFDVDSEGNLTQDWSTWQANIVEANLPATATETPQTLVMAVPGSIVPSSALPAGKTYVWALSLKDMSDGWITGSQHAVTLVASSAVTNTINFTATPPAETTQGATVSVAYSYTLASEGILKASLNRYNPEGNWEADITNFILNPAPATTTTPVTGEGTITLPADIVPSASLAAGYTYKWEIAVYDPSWSYFAGINSPVNVNAATAGIGENTIGTASVYPNPVSGRLNIIAKDIETVQVFDVTGKMLVNMWAADHLDVSGLSVGMYLLKVNNGNAVKFIKN